MSFIVVVFNFRSTTSHVFCSCFLTPSSVSGTHPDSESGNGIMTVICLSVGEEARWQINLWLSSLRALLFCWYYCCNESLLVNDCRISLNKSQLDMVGTRDGNRTSAIGCPSLSLFEDGQKLISVFFNRHGSMAERDRERAWNPNRIFLPWASSKAPFSIFQL